jgi:hypothetical protein
MKYNTASLMLIYVLASVPSACSAIDATSTSSLAASLEEQSRSGGNQLPSLAVFDHSHALQTVSQCNSTSMKDFFTEKASALVDPFSAVSNIQFPGSDLYLPVYEVTSKLWLGLTWFTEISKYKVSDQVFGHNGEHSQAIVQQFVKLLDFWNVPEQQYPILLSGAHSEDLKSNMDVAIQAWLLFQKDVPTFSDLDISFVAQEASAAIVDELDGTFSNSALSLDAFFVPLYTESTTVENKSVIVIGDGMLDFVEYLGGGELGNVLVLSHEFSHFLQFMMDADLHGVDAYYAEKKNSTNSRMSEMEADAMAAYVLANDQGGDLDIAQLVDLSELMFHFGDCNATAEDHHGTPEQRECAIRWGADTGMDLTGTPLTPQEFRSRFLANFQDILDLKHSACSITVGESADETGTSTTQSGFVFSASRAKDSIYLMSSIAALAAGWAFL